MRILLPNEILHRTPVYLADRKEAAWRVRSQFPTFKWGLGNFGGIGFWNPLANSTILSEILRSEWWDKTSDSRPMAGKSTPFAFNLMCENNTLDLRSMLVFPGTCTSSLFAVSVNPSTSTLKDLWGPKEPLLTRTECSGTGWGADFNLVLTGAPHYSPALVSALSCLINAT